MKKLISTILVISIALTGFFMTGCKSDTSLNGKWTPVSLTINGENQNVVDAFIEFKVNGNVATANGNSGVNLFYGNVNIKNHNFKADDFASTKMMGDPQADAFEQVFLSALMQATSYKIEDEKLVIFGPESTIEFVR